MTVIGPRCVSAVSWWAWAHTKLPPDFRQEVRREFWLQTEACHQKTGVVWGPHRDILSGIATGTPRRQEGGAECFHRGSRFRARRRYFDLRQGAQDQRETRERVRQQTFIRPGVPVILPAKSFRRALQKALRGQWALRRVRSCLPPDISGCRHQRRRQTWR